MKQRVPKELSDSASNLERVLMAIPEGRAIALSFARQIALTDDKYKELIRAHDENKKADLGKLCESLEIAPADFLAEINRVAYPVIDEALNLSKAISTGIVANRLPKVVERGMIEGAKAHGVTDRHFILQKEGFHVAPKGMNINLNQINQQSAGLESFEDQTRSLANILSVDGAVVEDQLLMEGETEYVDELETEDEKVEVAA